MNWIINSEQSLSKVIEDIRDLYNQQKFLKVSIKFGKDRSIQQNSASHLWYSQIAVELKEDDALGWKCYCKLHHGVPILRAEDADFKSVYDKAIKGMSYEKKLLVMRFIPVSSLMTKVQLTRYLEAIQSDFLNRGIKLKFLE